MDRRELERAAGAVLVPEVRAAGTRPGDPDHGDVRPDAAYLRRFPPAGVVVFGRSSDGPRDPRSLLEGVRADLEAAGEPVCFAACDLEQGAGGHFAGATRLPPALALAAAAAGARGGEERGLAWIRTAGAVTAHEARALGVELVLAPVADVNTSGSNPIIAVRSFGDEPALVTRRARAFHEGLRQGGAAGCAKHFPGHGAVDEDSHSTLPRLERNAAGLERIELPPFRGLVADEVACVMVGHLDVPALTGRPGLPTTLSARAIEGVLRERWGFRGAVLSDAMDMRALQAVEGAFPRALAAGCDGLLCPSEPEAAALELVEAVVRGELDGQRLLQAGERMRALHAAVRDIAAPGGGVGTSAEERARFARQVAAASLCSSTPRWPWRRGRPCEVLAPLHGPRSPEARALIHGLRDALAGGARPAGVDLPVVVETAAGSGAGGLGPEQLAQVEAKVASLGSLGWPVGLLWLGSPQTLPAAWWARPAPAVLVAFAPTPPQIEAAAAFLKGLSRPGGCLPCGLG